MHVAWRGVDGYTLALFAADLVVAELFLLGEDYRRAAAQSRNAAANHSDACRLLVEVSYGDPVGHAAAIWREAAAEGDREVGLQPVVPDCAPHEFTSSE